MKMVPDNAHIITKPVLRYWDSLNIYTYNVNLTLGTLACSFSLDSTKLNITTSSGGGHGEGTSEDGGRSAIDWINLLAEAEYVRNYYSQEAEPTQPLPADYPFAQTR